MKTPQWMIWSMMVALLVPIGAGTGRAQDAPPVYVGARQCGECHEEQYERFQKYSKKPHSFTSIQKMKKGLTDQELKECYRCHTTGYGQPGGFVSEAKTPRLRDLSCEVCHGPGSLHAESEDPDDIKAAVVIEDCRGCHSEERIAAFKYRPVLYGGAH